MPPAIFRSASCDRTNLLPVKAARFVWLIADKSRHQPAGERCHNQNCRKAANMLLYQAASHNASNPSVNPATFSVVIPNIAKDIMIEKN